MVFSLRNLLDYETSCEVLCVFYDGSCGSHYELQMDCDTCCSCKFYAQCSANHNDIYDGQIRVPERAVPWHQVLLVNHNLDLRDYGLLPFEYLYPLSQGFERLKGDELLCVTFWLPAFFNIRRLCLY